MTLSKVQGVQELPPDDPRATVCGHCGRGWDDAVVTAITPVPAGRCPFEYEHEYPEPNRESETMLKWNAYRDAERFCDEYAGDTQTSYLVVERYDSDDNETGQLYTMTLADWDAVKDEWDASIQYSNMQTGEDTDS